MAAVKTPSVEQVKAWLFPLLISIFSGYVWQDIREIKSDVKQLMSQSNIDKTRIDNLEREVFTHRTTSVPLSPLPKKDNTPVPNKTIVINNELIDTRKKRENYSIESI